MYTVQCTYMVEEPIFLSFAFRPRFNIGTDKRAEKSGATLRHMHSRYSPKSNPFICGASHRDRTFLDLPNSKRTL